MHYNIIDNVPKFVLTILLLNDKVHTRMCAHVFSVFVSVSRYENVFVRVQHAFVESKESILTC